VKSAFADADLAPLHLTSANSINIGRLLPQMFYYVSIYLDVAARAGDPVVFAVPSGNLGNLTAGVMAAQMGLPVSRFIAATNVNDVLPEYLASGTFRARPSISTLSNAMDVGDPSNFERLAALHGSSCSRMRGRIHGERVSETDTRAAIRQAYDESGTILDPHAAVAYAAARRFRAGGGAAPVLILATAHPAKFADVIREELGVEPELPDAERGWRDRPLLAVDLPGTSPAAFREFLESVSPRPS